MSDIRESFLALSSGKLGEKNWSVGITGRKDI